MTWTILLSTTLQTLRILVRLQVHRRQEFRFLSCLACSPLDVVLPLLLQWGLNHQELCVNDPTQGWRKAREQSHIW